MIEKIIDISDTPARLKVRDKLLVIEKGEDDEYSLPLREVGVLVVSNPVVTYTQAVLSGIAGEGGVFICCDGKHMPNGMLLPLAAHFVQGERFEQQAKASVPTRKKLWQQVVKAKIKAQGNLLKKLHGSDGGLFLLASKVKSGDPDNMEGTAARRYWLALFKDPGFRRDRDALDQNRFLNYGYAVLRAIVSRGICAAGLHPSLGLHHHNRYDSFRLSSDLMEPFRPVVDKAVFDWIGENGSEGPVDRAAKGHLIESLLGRFKLKKESRTLFDMANILASSLVQVFAGERKGLMLPEIEGKEYG